MASRFQDKQTVGYDSSTGTVEDEIGEIEGVQSISYGGGQRSRGRIVTVGARMPTGYTPGTVTPSEARLVMYRRQAIEWLKKRRDKAAPGRIGDQPIQFKIIYAPLDEEGSALPAQVDTFTALIDPPQDLGFDRTKEAEPLMMTIPLFVVSEVITDGKPVN